MPAERALREEIAARSVRLSAASARGPPGTAADASAVKNSDFDTERYYR